MRLEEFATLRRKLLMRIATSSFRIVPALAIALALIVGLAALAQQKTPTSQLAAKPAAASTSPAATVKPAPAATPPAAAAADAPKEQAMLDQYCVLCHSIGLRTAGVVLEGTDIAHVGT